MAQENLQLDSDFTYGEYGNQQTTFGPPPIPGSVAITTVNGITGPTITFDGGTSGFTFSPAGTTLSLSSPLTTKGDLYTRSSSAGTRLPVGANDSLLIPDSGEATGLKWVAGTWDAWTPTWTNLSVGNGTVVAAFKKIGKTIVCRLSLVFGNTTSITGAVSFTLPANRAAVGGLASVTPFGLAQFFDASAGILYSGVARARAANVTEAAIDKHTVSGTDIVTSSLSSTVPFTWTTSDEIACEFFYEAA